MRSWFLVALLAASMCLAVNGLHYWHEVRFSYAAVRFSLSEIVRGDFNPQQFGGRLDQASSAGFYQTKLLHVATLKTLFSMAAPDRGGLGLAIALSLVLFGSAAIVAREIFRRTFENDQLADLGFAAFIVSPIFPYLAGKLMSEVPAVFCGALAVWAGQRALSVTFEKHRRLYALGSGVLTLFTLLSRFDLLTMVGGFWAAVLITERNPERRNVALKTVSIVAAIATVGYIGVLLAIGGDPRTFVQYFRDFSSVGVRSPLMSWFGIVMFAGWTYVGLAFAFWSHRNDAKRFLLIWLLVSVGPMVAIASRYMIEPRYLIHGLIPLAGLAALGFEVAKDRFSIGRRSAIVMAMIVLATNWAAVRLMPYEINRSQILTAVDDIWRQEPDTAILIPWSYTDFHFLQVMRPNRPIFNVNGNLPSPNPLAVAWQKRATLWYGESFLNSHSRLEVLMRQRPIYYLGWHEYPPLQTASEWTRALGLVGLSRSIAALPSRDHLTESWVWKSGNYSFEQKGQSGQYLWYQLTTR